MGVLGKELEVVEQKLSTWGYFCILVSFTALMDINGVGLDRFLHWKIQSITDMLLFNITSGCGVSCQGVLVE